MGTRTVPATEAAQVTAEQSLPEVTRLEDIPAFANDEDAATFWDTHAPSKGFLEDAPEVAECYLPPTRPRTTPVAIRFDADTLARLKAIAKKKHKGYQTLLKEFVAERLYEEEQREGVIPPGRRR